MTDTADSPAPAKPKTWKDLGLRAVTAIILLALGFLPLYFGGPWWAGLVAVVCARMMWEWVRMSDLKAGHFAFGLPIIGLTAVAYLAYAGHIYAAFLGCVVVAILAGVERARRGGLKWATLGFLYISIPCVFAIWLRGDEAGFQADGFIKVLFIMLIVFAADIGAYFGGSYFRGPKIAPKLSPNKSWSGAVSGLIAGAVLGAIMANIIGFLESYGAFLAVPIVIFSVMGDFLESGLKRILKVKDAGDLLPGHGGFLDRLDSLMFAMVMAGVALIFIPGLWPA